MFHAVQTVVNFQSGSSQDIVSIGPLVPGQRVPKLRLNVFGVTGNDAGISGFVVQVRAFAVKPANDIAVFNNGRAITPTDATGGAWVGLQVSDFNAASSARLYADVEFPLNHVVTQQERYVGVCIDTLTYSPSIKGSIWLEVIEEDGK